MNNIRENLRLVRVGLLVATLSILFGFGLGGVFGAAEGSVKSSLEARATAVFATVYKNDKQQMEKTLAKSWSYLKRAHLHGGAIGSAAVVLILLLSFLDANQWWKFITSIFLGLGSLGYSCFWLFAAFRAPTLGSTGLAKESLSWMAVPSAFMSLAGVASVAILIIYALFVKKTEE